MSPSREMEAVALDSLADESEAEARKQREVAAGARQMAQERRKGTPWQSLASRVGARRLVDLLYESSRRLRENAGRLRALVAGGLSAEGSSTRDIGLLFGVTHQRISSLINKKDQG